MLESIKERAGGNVSGYIRNLVEADLRGQPEPARPLSPNILVEIAKVLIGELDAQDVERRVAGQDQRRLLQAWLLSLAKEAAEEEEEPSTASAIRQMRLAGVDASGHQLGKPVRKKGVGG